MREKGMKSDGSACRFAWDSRRPENMRICAAQALLKNAAFRPATSVLQGERGWGVIAGLIPVHNGTILDHPSASVSGGAFLFKARRKSNA